MKECPFCGARQIGKIGRERYYCSVCCHEWTGNQDKVKIYKIFSDGSFTCLKEENRNNYRHSQRKHAS